MEYTTASAAARLKELLILKGKAPGDLEDALKMNHDQIVKAIKGKDYGIISRINDELGGGMINQYFHNPSNFGIVDGQVRPLTVEKRR